MNASSNGCAASKDIRAGRNNAGLSEAANEKPPHKEVAATISAGSGERPFHCFQIWICHLHLKVQLPAKSSLRTKVAGRLYRRDEAQSAFEIRV